MQLKEERETISREVDQLRRSVDSLNQEIAGYQAQLPTAGKLSGIKRTNINFTFLQGLLKVQL